MLTIVRPESARLLSREITYSAVDASSPVVGSSRNKRLGFVSNSTPIFVLFLSPPETPRMNIFPTKVSAHFNRPKSFNRVSTLAIFSYLLALSFKLAEKLKDSFFFNPQN